jgi:hypothetical protein
MDGLRRLVSSAPELLDCLIELPCKLFGALAAQDLGNVLVIPKRSLLSACESRPHRSMMLPQVRQRLPGVVQLVCCGNQPHRAIGISPQVRQIAFLAFEPGRLGLGIGIRTALDNSRHACPKFSAYIGKPRLSALILYRIMQKRGDGFVLIAAMSQNHRCYAQQMSYIRTRSSLAELSGMDVCGVAERAPESRSQPKISVARPHKTGAR